MDFTTTIMSSRDTTGVELWLELTNDGWAPRFWTFTSATRSGLPPERWHRRGWVRAGRYERPGYGLGADILHAGATVPDDLLDTLAASYEEVWDGSNHVGRWDPDALRAVEGASGEALWIEHVDGLFVCAACDEVLDVEDGAVDDDRCEACASEAD